MGQTARVPRAAPAGNSWRAPRNRTAEAVDAVLIARVQDQVFLRSTLSRPIAFTPAAWEDFKAAVKAGDYDDV
ncbi:hypothetical protein Ga0074812_15221 [Parafrankia irregularis]|uniref:DUF397 domain-containing protein n=1 Tax=Parafrankia irregularis TaxID=795642 RepID=A0A0S4R0E5_9ACTN|nr:MULTISPECIES: DUF397 domain-containing protein [Parafrankia]MBE3206703.1 DUF397 domain-containing protein [Parafrankia sp. CH37]CUU60996.1 hypothetical protein Ga0074812_15221 [Parafrankia irregularis]